ncbi:MAG: SPOR domain-containing protein [Prevotella sp.]|uniref:SPOR domain-containing protein n=1 Tax=Prevotella sp. TaxID=59823 RepID=UPI002A2C82F3|nr:SPOR domain-containing protein [Prevotella sp.]MDD7318702.1 SPOR domain-containing protein [Prevotellaceae bacterium]MDY4019345.1 SPOR domain-containing protein [Prevotella sp.]
MKKYMLVSAGLVLALAFTSCNKTSESAYRKMYDAAKSNGGTDIGALTGENAGEETVVVAPVTERPITEITVTDNYDNVSVRQENVRVVNGNGLRNFSVVVGSFSVDANAYGLQQKLKDAGYDAQVAYSDARRMYRVIVATFDNKADAARSRNEFRSQYPDAWLLSPEIK